MGLEITYYLLDLSNMEANPSFLCHQCFLVQVLLVRSSQNDKSVISLYQDDQLTESILLKLCETSKSTMKLYIKNWNSNQILPNPVCFQWHN